MAWKSCYLGTDCSSVQEPLKVFIETSGRSILLCSEEWSLSSQPEDVQSLAKLDQLGQSPNDGSMPCSGVTLQPLRSTIGQRDLGTSHPVLLAR